MISFTVPMGFPALDNILPLKQNRIDSRNHYHMYINKYLYIFIPTEAGATIFGNFRPAMFFIIEAV